MALAQRRLARTLAFQTLFELESRPESRLDDVFNQRAQVLQEETGQHVGKSAANFASQLLAGTLRERSKIDEILSKAAPAFPLTHMPPTERAILELAVHEMMDRPSTPIRVVINEAVELAKTYGGENSGRFVNGVLGTIAESLGHDHANPTQSENENQ